MKSKNYRSNHALEILTSLNNDRKKVKQYCDVTLSAESNDFPGHKCVLSVFSTFFSKVFSIEMKEKYEGKGNVQGVTEETLEAVLNFIYTCDITITSENVFNLIEAANYMEVPHLKKFCMEFLLEDIDATNCLHIRAYSKLYDLDKLVEKADVVIADHFESLINEKEFNRLEFKDIKDLLALENKKVTSEKVVYDGMIQWVKHDITTREKHLNDIFTLLKLNNLSADFLQDVVGQEELVKNNKDCLLMCFQSMASQLRVQQHSQAIAEQQKAEKHFLAFQGRCVWKYNVLTKTTNALPQTTTDHTLGSAVHHQRNVYAISGHSSNIIEKFDLDDEDSGWTRLVRTNVKRNGGASVVFDDSIYNCGGINSEALSNPHFDPYSAQPHGQRYDIKNKTWNRMDDMNANHWYFALVSTNIGLYAIGGFNGLAISNTVEFHDPRQGGWKILPSMNSARQGLVAVVLNDKIYAIGGACNGVLKSVERFDPLDQTWVGVADMNFPRRNHGACVLNGKIYVTGGGSSAVEVYDPERDFWNIEADIPKLSNVEFIVAVQ